MTAFNCEAKQNTRGQWCVTSPYWSIPAMTKRDAERLCEIIMGAHNAGRESLRDDLNALLNPPMEGIPYVQR